jgi:hypothetical protein
MKLGEFTSECESDPNSPLLAPLGSLDLVEALEYTVLFFARNPGPCVRNLNGCAGRIVEYLYVNAAP